MRKVRRTLIYTFFAACLIIMLISISCSTAPKNPGDIYTLRSNAEAMLEAANKDAGRGNFKNALLLLDQCKRIAILTDDSSLIIRSCLSRGNVLLTGKKTDDAFAEWKFAIDEAQRFGNAELLSVSKIFRARGNLVSGRAGAQAVLDEVNRESANIKNDRLYIAFSWQVKGLALRALGLSYSEDAVKRSLAYREAEDAVKRSLEIHERDRYLENASYDWYVIASIRSLAGDTTGALAALDTSMELDRRIENSWGLAASWRAKGDVYRKAGRNSEADDAYRRALAIYLAIPNKNEAAETERRMRNGE